MLIGIVGFNGAGKDTAAKYLVTTYGFSHVDIGDEIRFELKKGGKNYLDRSEMLLLANEYRERFGNDYWARRALSNYSSSKNLVVTSLRNPSEVDLIKSNGGVIIEIFADIKTRYFRTVERVRRDPGSHGDVSSFKDFKMKEDVELKSNNSSGPQGLRCVEMADYRVDNNGSEGELFFRLGELIKRIKNKGGL